MIVQEKANNSIEARYEEIKEKRKEKLKKLEELKKMYLLDNETLADNKISINDTERKFKKNIIKQM